MSMHNGALVWEIVKHRTVRWKDPLNGRKTHTGLDCVERKLLFPVWKKQTEELRKRWRAARLEFPNLDVKQTLNLYCFICSASIVVNKLLLTS